ncbi:hypothetical protein [Micromonospora aurantiaca (nom. illeg.)]|uniref:hypothetical protein n=1 Tax=Micromonospora aurantiaca (nom. illeg.) TaxID=47850 RepID=UPI0011A3877C|nr:hypothetical protein [Micromonospora aurantiaca]MBC9000444.1 hypothetical protein [Micromonospora aurantiaca]
MTTTTVAPPAIHPAPAAPDWWEIQGTELPDDIAGPARFGDPADLTALERAVVATNAVDAIARWHRIADDGRVPTPAWKQLLMPDSWSGHKLYAPAATLADVRAALAAVFPIVWAAGLGMKAATSPTGLLHGKGVVIYLPRRVTVDRDTSLVAAALADYRPARPVTCTGATRLADGLWWRHEFGGVDLGYDVYDPREYRARYAPAAATR